MAPGSAEVPDWLRHDHPVGDSRVSRGGTVQEWDTPYGTVSWSLRQARRWAVLTTLSIIPTILILIYLAYLIDNLYASLFLIICCAGLMAIDSLTWMRVRAIERTRGMNSQEESEA